MKYKLNEVLILDSNYGDNDGVGCKLWWLYVVIKMLNNLMWLSVGPATSGSEGSQKEVWRVG